MLGADILTGDVVIGGFFYGDRCVWTLVKRLATIWLLLHV